MHCVLFRHGDKEFAIHSDPPLSAKGQSQAFELARRVQTGHLPKPEILLSSPKIRAVQTFEPLAQQMNVVLKIRPELEERQSSEENSQFLQRIRNQWAWLTSFAEKSPQTCYIVTHSDWIVEALPMIPSSELLTDDKYQWWRPCQYLHLEFIDGLWIAQGFDSIVASQQT